MKLTIKRSEWLHGEGGPASRLLRPADGKMCCLGFYCKAIGIDESGIAGLAIPTEIEAQYRRTAERAARWLFQKEKAYERSRDCSSLMVANDLKAGRRGMTEEYREERVKEIFAKHDVEVEFV